MVLQEKPHIKSKLKSKRKVPTMCIFAEKQALLDISTMSIPTLNIKEIEPAQTKDAFVATISPSIPISFSVMNARRREVRQPPQQQKEDEQQTIHAIQRTDVAGF